MGNKNSFFSVWQIRRESGKCYIDGRNESQIDIKIGDAIVSYSNEYEGEIFELEKNITIVGIFMYNKPCDVADSGWSASLEIDNFDIVNFKKFAILNIKSNSIPVA